MLIREAFDKRDNSLTQNLKERKQIIYILSSIIYLMMKKLSLKIFILINVVYSKKKLFYN